MGKILKYCGSCEEGFAERFTFCPDCGASLQAVELNPVAEELKIEAAEPAAPAFIAEPEPEAITAPFTAEPETGESGYNIESVSAAEKLDTEFASAVYETGPLETPEEVQSSRSDAAASGSFYYTAPEMNADEPRKNTLEPSDEDRYDGGYYVTVIQEKNTKQRNMLLLGSSAFILIVTMAVTVVSLFSKDLNVGSIDDNPLFSAVLYDEIPMVVEEEEKKDDDEGGGGGGGGKDEEKPASVGDLPDQARNPVRAADVNTPRFENPSLPLPQPQTQGPPRTFENKYDRYGTIDGLDALSNGPGTGGGIGSGTGTGVGTGSGSGIGSGTGSGMGGGTGDGIGDGRGSGSGPPPVVRAPVTEALKILSKPQAKYNDAGRTNAVQGTVRLKIMLLASGAVGSITPVTRLPHGMTEQAIAAARQIKFVPKKVNGVAQSVIVTFEYNFNLY